MYIFYAEIFFVLPSCSKEDFIINYSRLQRFVLRRLAVLERALKGVRTRKSSRLRAVRASFHKCPFRANLIPTHQSDTLL